MLRLLIIIIVIAALASLPTWQHSRDWGYFPVGGLGLVAIILIVLLIAGYL